MLEAATLTKKPEDLGRNSRATEFRKQLRWKIMSCQTTPYAEIMVIDPTMAVVMLERNRDEEWQNRPETKTARARYAKTMAEKRWKLTGEPLIFSKKGNLINGQHRLHACVDSGKSFETFVVFGIDDDAFAFIDIGTKRSPGHIFAIEGVPNAASAAAMTKLIVRYDNHESVGSRQYHDNDALYRSFLALNRPQDSVHVGQAIGVTRLLSPRYAAFCHYICARLNRKAADDFYRKIQTGLAMESAKDPAYVLRNRLMSGQIGSEKLDPVVAAALTIKAWNAMRRGLTVGALRWRTENSPNEEFPRAV